MRVLIPVVLFLLIGCAFRDDSNVKVVDLSNRKLSAIPDSIYLMDKLEYLDLGNSFTIYPPLSALPSDDHSEDNMNQITQISENISQLRQLKVLNMCANDLRSLPRGLVKLRTLDTLNISLNKHLQLSNELETLSKMTWLKYLNIMGTNTDQKSIDEIKKTLSATKIIVNMDDIIDRHMIDSLTNAVISLQYDSMRNAIEVK